VRYAKDDLDEYLTNHRRLSTSKKGPPHEGGPQSRRSSPGVGGIAGQFVIFWSAIRGA
jgi:hypothetical protein